MARKRETGTYLSVLGFGRGQPGRRDHAGAGAERERDSRLYRHAGRGAEGAGRPADRRAVSDRRRREDPGRMEPCRSRRIPADRLRNPQRCGAKISTTTPWTRARSGRAPR